MHLSEQKTQLRDAIEERLGRVNEQERASESRSLCKRLLPLLPLNEPVCGYVPLASEADITSLLQTLIDRGTPLYLPVFAQRTLTFRRCENFADLQKGELGIREPAEGTLLEGTAPLTVLVPGRAFDVRGNRLGRGNGGYDRWIASQKKTGRKLTCIGVALDCQIVPEVPAEPHDERMDLIATPRSLTPALR